MIVSFLLITEMYAVVKLFRHECWRSAWIVPEVALALGLALHCGFESMVVVETIPACDAVLEM